MKMMNNFYQQEANDGTSGDAVGGAAVAETTSAATGSLLSQSAVEAKPNDWLPEKYRVNKDDGAFDLEASSRKVAEAYSHLEKRMGSGDTPPKTAEEYAPILEVEGFNFDEFKADPESQSFLKSAHAKGLTNDQLSFVLGEYLQRAPNLVQGAQVLDAETATADLKQVWKSDAEFKENMNLAFNAFNALADDADKARIDDVGNNPIVLKMLAKIGKEMQEDKPIHGNSDSTQSGDFEERAYKFRKELALLNLNDPKRKLVTAEYDALYAQRYSTKKAFTGGGTATR